MGLDELACEEEEGEDVEDEQGARFMCGAVIPEWYRRLASPPEPIERVETDEERGDEMQTGSRWLQAEPESPAIVEALAEQEAPGGFLLPDGACAGLP